MERGRTMVAIGLVAFLVGALGVPSLAGQAGAVGGTRYVDAVFAGQLAPVQEVSYDPTVPLNSRHTLTVFATSGTYSLTYRGATTAPIARGATALQVQAALQALPTVDHDGVPGSDVTVSGGIGAGNGGRHYRVTFNDALAPGDAFGRLTATDLTLAGGQDKVIVRCERCGDVHRPDEATPPAGGRPVVLLLHGGGFSGGAKDPASGDALGTRMQAWASALAERGYVAVPINYALEDPADLPVTACDWDAVVGPACPAVWQDALTAARHDAQAAVRWLRWTAEPVASGGLGNPYGIDPSRIVVAGESAGAMTALGVLYRSDDPGTVGLTGPSSAVAAGVSVAGLTVDAWQDAGEGPALLLSFTNDPMAEIWGSDFYEEGREVVARAKAVGNVAQLASWCTRYDQGTDGIADPVHLVDLARPEWAQQVDQTARFLFERVVGPTPSGAGATWQGTSRTTPFTVGGASQTMLGAHRPAVGDLDGDGLDDIVWYGPGAECDTVWWGQADGTFVDPDEVNAFVYAPALDLGGDHHPVVLDVDGDGADEVFLADPYHQTALELLTTGHTRTVSKVAIGELGPGLTYLPADLDGDGHGDMVLHYGPGAGAVVAYGGVPGAWFVDLEIVWGTAATPDQRPAIGDVDGDGRDDLVLAGSTGVEVWYGEPRASASPFDQRPAVAAPNGRPVVLDADGDGRDDAFVHVPGGTSSIVYGSPTRGALVKGKSWVLPATTVAAGVEVDGDGRGDLLWRDPGTGATSVWFGTTSRAYLPFVAGAGPTARAGAEPLVVGLDAVPGAGGHQRDDLLWSVG